MDDAPLPDAHLLSLLAGAEAARDCGDHQRGAELARQAAELADAGQDAALVAQAREALAFHLGRLGQLEAAVDQGHQALGHFEHAGPPAALARARCTLSWAYERAGLTALAIGQAAAGLEAAVAAGDAVAECVALNRLGTAMTSDDGRGIEMLERALALSRQLPADAIGSSPANNLARRRIVEADRLAAAGQDPRPALGRARALLLEALADRRGPANVFNLATVHANLAGVHRRLGEVDAARQQFETALGLARAHGFEGLAATVVLAQACLAVEVAATPATCGALEHLLEHHTAAADADLLRQARRVLVDGWRATGDLARALAQLERLHADAMAEQAQRSDLQSRLMFNHAELDLARRRAADRDELERQVAARTAELQRALLAAEAGLRAKSALMSGMNHELRTPLNGLLGLVELARRRATDERQADQLARAAQMGRALAAEMDDLLNLVALQAEGPPLAAPTDVAGLLADVVQRLQPLAASRGAAIAPPPPHALPPRLKLDARWTARLLQSLVDDALAGGHAASLQMAARWQPPGALWLEVRGGAAAGDVPVLVQRLAEALGGTAGVQADPPLRWVQLPAEPA